ncbi:MAG TPA: hypothetical protein VGA19_01080 [Rhodospirillales bacterium]
MKSIRVLSLVVGMALAAIALPASAADLVVVASSAPDLAPGTVVKSEAVLKVPAGASVTLISGTGKTVTLKGPHAGPPGVGGDGAGSPDLIASLSGLLAGSGKETAALGTMRALAPPAPPTDPWVIDVGQSGDHCVAATGPATLWRGSSSHARLVSIIDLKDNSQLDVDWPAGAATLAWPSKVPLADGGRYLVRMKGSATAAKLTVHRLPAQLPTDAHRAAWMADKGCRPQARRLLAAIR